MADNKDGMGATDVDSGRRSSAAITCKPPSVFKLLRAGAVALVRLGDGRQPAFGSVFEWLTSWPTLPWSYRGMNMKSNWAKQHESSNSHMPMPDTLMLRLAHSYQPSLQLEHRGVEHRGVEHRGVEHRGVEHPQVAITAI